MTQRVKSLPYRARIWVPANAVVARKEFELGLGEIGLGFTATPGNGGYVPEGAKGTIVYDSIVEYEVFYTDDHWQVETMVYEMIDALRAFGEQTVLAELHGKAALYA